MKNKEEVKDQGGGQSLLNESSGSPHIGKKIESFHSDTCGVVLKFTDGSALLVRAIGDGFGNEMIHWSDLTALRNPTEGEVGLENELIVEEAGFEMEL